MSPRLINAIALAIVVTWVMSNILDAIPSLNYTPPANIDKMMLALSGSAFVVGGVKGAMDRWGKNGNGKQDGGSQ